MILQAVATKTYQSGKIGGDQPDLGAAGKSTTGDLYVKSESSEHKAVRVALRTLVAVGVGSAVGYAGQHQQPSGWPIGSVTGAVVGTVYGTSTGWQVGECVRQHTTNSNEQPSTCVRALDDFIGGPLVGAVSGGVAGLCVGSMVGTIGSPLVGGIIMGGLSFIREVCR